MKHCIAFRAISLALIISFIAFDISWAYPPDRNEYVSTLAVEGMFQEKPMTSRAEEAQEFFCAEACLLNAISTISQGLFIGTLRVMDVAPILGGELKDAGLNGDLSDAILPRVDLSHVTVVKGEKLEQLRNDEKVPADAIILIPYKRGDKTTAIIGMSLKDNPVMEIFPGYPWNASVKYAIRVVTFDYREPVTQTAPAPQSLEIVSGNMPQEQIVAPDQEQNVAISEKLATAGAQDISDRPDGGQISVISRLRPFVGPILTVIVAPLILLVESPEQYGEVNAHLSITGVLFYMAISIPVTYAAIRVAQYIKRKILIRRLRAGNRTAVNKFIEALKSDEERVRKDAIFTLIAMHDWARAETFQYFTDKPGYPVNHIVSKDLDILADCLIGRIGFKVVYLPEVSMGDVEDLLLDPADLNADPAYPPEVLERRRPVINRPTIDIIPDGKAASGRSNGVSLLSPDPFMAAIVMILLTPALLAVKDYIVQNQAAAVIIGFGVLAVLTFVTWRYLSSANRYLRRINSRNPNIRRAAAEMLGKVGIKTADRPPIVRALIEKLSDETPSVRVAAAASLGKLKDKSAVKPLIDIICDPDEGVRAAVCSALGDLCDRVATPDLIQILVSPRESWIVKEAAANAYQRLNPIVANVTAGKGAIKNQASEAREKGIPLSREGIKHKTVVQSLVHLLSDDGPLIRRDAASALYALILTHSKESKIIAPLEMYLIATMNEADAVSPLTKAGVDLIVGCLRQDNFFDAIFIGPETHEEDMPENHGYMQKVIDVPAKLLVHSRGEVVGPEAGAQQDVSKGRGDSGSTTLYSSPIVAIFGYAATVVIAFELNKLLVIYPAIVTIGIAILILFITSKIIDKIRNSYTAHDIDNAGGSGADLRMPDIFDPDVEVRKEAIESLRRLVHDVGATEGHIEQVYIYALRHSPDSSYRAIAAEELARRGSLSALQDLIESSADPSRGLRWAASEALGMLGHEDATLALIERLSDEGHKERMEGILQRTIDRIKRIVAGSSEGTGDATVGRTINKAKLRIRKLVEKYPYAASELNQMLEDISNVDDPRLIELNKGDFLTELIQCLGSHDQFWLEFIQPEPDGNGIVRPYREVHDGSRPEQIAVALPESGIPHSAQRHEYEVPPPGGAVADIAMNTSGDERGRIAPARVFEAAGRSFNNYRDEYIAAGNKLTGIAAELNPDMCSLEIEQIIERAINEAILPEDKAKLESLRSGLILLMAKGVIASAKILANRIKEDRKKLAVAIETDWIPGINDAGSLQVGAMKRSGYMKGKIMMDLENKLSPLGVIVKFGSCAHLASSLRQAIADGETTMGDVVMITSEGAYSILYESLKDLMGSDKDNRPFRTSIDPAELIKQFEDTGSGIDPDKQLYIQLLSLLCLTLEVASGKDPGKIDGVTYYDESRTLSIKLPRTAVMPCGELEKKFEAELIALRAA